MEHMNILFSGLLDLPWWGHVIAALILTHITIACVTIFLHRCQTHRALDLHAIPSHFFRLWLWLTTGMVTKEWVAVHRKHHAKCDMPDDPHSPQIHGLNAILFGGVIHYVRSSADKAMVERYGNGTPDDWLERNIYSQHVILGLTLMGAIDILVFGVVPGLLILITQIAWIPFWAAGVINGVGHFWGYRSWAVGDWSTNIGPLGLLIGGEELHNNHHAYPTSARLSYKWYEFDIGWLYIRILETLGLAKVKYVSPVPSFGKARAEVDERLLNSVIVNRYDVLARFSDSLQSAISQENARLSAEAPAAAAALGGVASLLNRDEKTLSGEERARLDKALAASRVLAAMYAMRRELMALWGRSLESRDQVVAHLRDWCKRAESSGISPLAEFSNRLRTYA